MRLTMFMLVDCPYCRKARLYIEQLKQEEPALAAVEIHEIDEQLDMEVAARFDYYYVPCFFLGDKKLHEGAVTKEKMRSVLEQVLESGK